MIAAQQQAGWQLSKYCANTYKPQGYHTQHVHWKTNTISRTILEVRGRRTYLAAVLHVVVFLSYSYHAACLQRSHIDAHVRHDAAQLPPLLATQR